MKRFDEIVPEIGGGGGEGGREARGEVHEALAWRWGLTSSLWCGPVWTGRHGWQSWIAPRVQVRVRHGTEIGGSILGQELARCCSVFVFMICNSCTSSISVSC